MATEMTLREMSNARILNHYFNENPSLGYDGRTNPVTKANLERTFRKMTDYDPTYNSFVSWLLNRIGRTIFTEKKSFTNPLAEFKDDSLAYGSVVQEVATGLLRAHVYDPQDDGETVFSREVPPTKAIYHEMNRQEYYKLTVNREQLGAAFLSESGLTSYVDQLLSTPVTSDNVDEFNYMIDLLRKYDTILGGFYYMKGGSTDLTSDENRAKDLVKKIRALGTNMAYPNVHYNAGGMPAWADPSEIIIITTPEIAAMIDVDALAAAFNVDRMEFPQRIITIPTHLWPFGDRANAIVTTRWFFRVFDMLTTFTEIQNPQSLNRNYFLHRWSIISCTPFAPAIMLTNELETITVDVPPAEVTIGSVAAIDWYPRNAGESLSNVRRGDELALDATITVNDPALPITRAITWEVRGNTSPRTSITKDGTLIVSQDERADTLTVRCYFADEPTVPGTEKQIPVVGDPVPVIARNDDFDGDGVPNDEDDDPVTPVVSP